MLLASDGGSVSVSGPDACSGTRYRAQGEWPGLSLSIGDGISGLGATRWRWRWDVRQNVRELARQFPQAVPNTYICHPWCGWGRVSVDFWGPNGRGDPIDASTGWQLLRRARSLAGPPHLRHTIYMHEIWTSFGGTSWWAPDDHSGNLRHVHLTYWR